MTSGEKGSALMIVVIFLTLALLTLSSLFEQTRFLFALEEDSRRIPNADNGTEKALGIAISRLRSGVPDSSYYACRLRLRDAAGSDVESYHVIYNKIASDRWTLEAVPSDAVLEDCPGLFIASCPVAP